jgi:hypothetical protein
MLIGERPSEHLAPLTPARAVLPRLPALRAMTATSLHLPTPSTPLARI